MIKNKLTKGDTLGERYALILSAEKYRIYNQQIETIKGEKIQKRLRAISIIRSILTIRTIIFANKIYNQWEIIKKAYKAAKKAGKPKNELDLMKVKLNAAKIEKDNASSEAIYYEKMSSHYQKVDRGISKGLK